jgi:hypothetical protein
VNPRPPAATLVPVVLLALAVGGALAFHGRQESSGRASLHAEATTWARLVEARTQTAVSLREVSVEGDRGVATFVLSDGGAYGRAVQVEWRRQGDGWAPVEREEVGPRPLRPGPFGRR